MPFGFRLAADTLPSGVLRDDGFRSALSVSGFRLRARLDVSIPSHLSPASEALPPLSDMAPLIRAPEGLQPSGTTRCPAHNMPSADSCTVVNGPCEPLSPHFRTPCRPPEVSATAFPTHLPDLPPQPLMAMDFAINCLLVRPGRPRIWFLFVRSWLCYTLPSDPASRRRPCVSLVLHHHQVGQGTHTPKLLRMLGAQ
ncbi:hypothetical protein B0G76_2026 [Paraburkholderia sp. BL23I1N1]|nr:hypothetical protein B0G76_7021 [Paraburkholderia sp. BL23I1N1]RKE26026.1 hypothetical protein B0G76_7615 [Paraburkholderia sp. BL23I1N1]RKE35854.1 hypothetical protein B0G76_1980 [Paraburkholderia sp. BL23I1N1]RKE35895.1 hypothetical protein B0G76_2026 [Paraburkholderia sp. BL23I1N1]